MRFGFFDQLPCASGDSEPRRFRDFMAQIELGDTLGFDTVWLGELHFTRGFSILADPLMVLAAAGRAGRLGVDHRPDRRSHRRLADLLRQRVSQRGMDLGAARPRPARSADVAAVAGRVGTALQRAALRHAR